MVYKHYLVAFFSFTTLVISWSCGPLTATSTGNELSKASITIDNNYAESIFTISKGSSATDPNMTVIIPATRVAAYANATSQDVLLGKDADSIYVKVQTVAAGQVSDFGGLTKLQSSMVYHLAFDYDFALAQFRLQPSWESF